MAGSKRKDGLKQRNITLGRDENGKYIRKSIYGRTKRELDEKELDLRNHYNQGLRFDDKTTFDDIAKVYLEKYCIAMNTSPPKDTPCRPDKTVAALIINTPRRRHWTLRQMNCHDTLKVLLPIGRIEQC